MTEPTHTPLPWVANDQHSGANPWRIETDDGVWANNGWIIAECCGPDAEANAAFIVQAANSHHRLVEALEWYGDTFCELGKSHECCGRLTDDECSGCKARSLLAALKEAGR